MTVNIVIGSYLEPEYVKKIEAFSDEIRVHYRPDLLPVPRYVCDHSAPPRELTKEQLDEWRSTVALADVFFDFDWNNPVAMPEESPNLKWIQATSAGIGAFMHRTKLDESTLTVTTAGGIHAAPLAEFALLGALYFVKGVPHLMDRKREHHWQRYTTRQLKGMRALVVGLGGVGREVVREFSALGVEVVGLGRSGRVYDIHGLTRVIDRSQLDEVLPSVDFLVLCSALTKETEGMIGARQLEMMHSESVVINLSRGQLIDQGAFYKALLNHTIGGACLDVFEVEPLPKDDPMWDLDNVIISPHSASTVQTENGSLVDLFLENFASWREGLPMRNLFNPVTGY
ncbi:MAG TPA: D-2-hydroxyacid dehydrogenase [Acidimicrobiales bacterium]|nr:D-2-hydroxyacid dehydrogenase [Acidimicrobiales bacterium]